jgi:hypothetical protein
MAADNQATAVPVRNRFKAALTLLPGEDGRHGHTVASWARTLGHTESLVWMNLSGERYTPEIRADIAAVLGMAVEALDAEIAQERAAA